ncbi:MAG: hypothetical protein JWO02_1485 [Solirubrobacterales bacterium]|nr:hypothetical protein [Solirubrobacterales bacterium]
MSVLRNLESRIAGLVEGTFGRVFKTEVRPVELAHKLAKEMDEHRTVSVSRTYVPNEYVVWLSPKDRARYDGVEHEVADELSAYLLEHARRERVSLVSTPVIEFRTDDALRLGEFGIQARLVRPAQAAGEAPVRPAVPGGDAPVGGSTSAPVEQGDHGHTMVYSTAARVQGPLREERAAAAAVRPPRAFVLAEGKRMPVPAEGAVIGRSRECDIVLADANISRRHAELRWTGGPPSPGWTINDMGSTNGVRVNGRPITAATAVAGGDRIELGTVPIGFEVER